MATAISKYGKMKKQREKTTHTETNWLARDEGGKNSHKPLEIDIDISQNDDGKHKRKRQSEMQPLSERESEKEPTQKRYLRVVT